MAMVTEVTIKGSVANTLAGLPLQPVAEEQEADKLQEADKTDKESELAEGEARRLHREDGPPAEAWS